MEGKKIRILLLGDLSNPHMIRWANSLNDIGYDLTLFTVSNFNEEDFNDDIKIESYIVSDNIKSRPSGSIQKGAYLFSLFKLKKVIKKFKPDFLHAHFASSYGLLGALTKFKPFYLSVWGIDVTIFPHKSVINKFVLQYTLNQASRIFATSNYLASETKIFTKKNINVIPFGVDTTNFKIKINIDSNTDQKIKIGCIKSLENKYGLENLILIFSQLIMENPERNLELYLIGGGSLEKKLKDLVNELGIVSKVIFTGKINNSKINDYHNLLDIAVYLSDYESFGVSILESMACGKPVVVNNVGGLNELISDGIEGLIVERGNNHSAKQAIEKLIFDKALRKKLGENARERVVSHFEWTKSVHLMSTFYYNS